MQQLRRGELVERTETPTSAARVLAIYPGTPFVVVTDAQPITGTPSERADPFTAQSDRVTLFIAPEQHTAMSKTTQAALPGKTAWSTGWS